MQFQIFAVTIVLAASCASEPVVLREDPPSQLALIAQPDVDHFFTFAPGVGYRIDAASLFEAPGGSEGEPQNVFHVGTVETRTGPTEIYRWTESIGWGPLRQDFTCVGSTSTGACNNVDYPSSFGNFGSGSDGSAVTSLIDYVPAGAAAVVVEFESGRRYGSAVVDGLAFIQYSEDDGEVLDVTALPPGG